MSIPFFKLGSKDKIIKIPPILKLINIHIEGALNTYIIFSFLKNTLVNI